MTHNKKTTDSGYVNLNRIPGVVGWFRPDSASNTITQPTVSADLTTWATQGVTVASTTIGDGFPAYKILEDTSTGYHRIYLSSISNATADTTLPSDIRVSMLQGAGSRNVMLEVLNGATATEAYFDPSSGATVSTVNYSTGTVTTSANTLINGLLTTHECILVSSENSATEILLDLSSGTTLSYTGDGTSYVYMWSPQYIQNGSVHTLANLSTNSTNMGDAIQATFAKQPVVTPFNARDGMRFTATADMHFAASVGTTIGPPFAVFSVVDYTGDNAAAQRIWQGGSGGVYVSGGTILFVVVGMGTMPLGKHVVCAINDGVHCSILVDGVLSGETSSSTGITTTFTIGDNGASGSAWNGYMGDTVVYDGDPFADGTFDTINNALMQYYNIG